MKASVAAIEYSLPEALLKNEELAAKFSDWTSEKITDKTGITERHIAGADECASDIAVQAAQKLFDSHACRREDVDFLLLCTQSPDYFLPTTACLVQDRLGLPTTCGALDFNLGCSGFVYGLGLAKGLIETAQAKNVLLVTAETYSKFIHENDRSVRTIFGDGAAATLIQGVQIIDETSDEPIGPFIYGTDGRGAKNLIVPVGGMRQRNRSADEAHVDEFGNERTSSNLYMNGGEIFNFTLRAVPEAIGRLLETMRLRLEDIDLIVFHQANRYMLDHLRKKLKIPEEKFVVAMERVGNTVSSTIPIALSDAAESGRLKDGQRIMVVGFGVGYSWAATVLRWRMGRS
jgi:3-oxoacyl-[acyl-carrier-protein] synthase-3